MRYFQENVNQKHSRPAIAIAREIRVGVRGSPGVFVALRMAAIWKQRACQKGLLQTDPVKLSHE
jgi:hypothetical protein